MRLRGSLGLILLLALNLFGARAFLLQPSIEVGESATLVLSANGESIKFPTIEQIDGFKIVSHQSRQSMEYVNGKVTKQLDRYLTFYPDHNVTIPSYEIIVDGKKELTEPITLSFAETSAISSQRKPFSFEMKVSNATPLRHEGVKLSFIFKRNQHENLMDMRFLKPTLDGFWVKELGKDTPHIEGDDIVHTIHYMIYPQKSGEVHIAPAKIEVARQVSSRDIFMSQIQWKSIVSNDVTLHVKPLDGVELLGEFAMDIKVDKQEIASNEGLNVTLTITGEGNFDDIESFKLNLPEAVVFSDDPKIKTWVEGEKLKGEFVQKFAINAQKSFDIAPLELRFYNPLKKRIETLYTQTQHIIVHPKSLTSEASQKGVAKEEEKISDTKVTQVTWHMDLFSFTCGFLCAVFIMFMAIVAYRFKKREPKPRNTQNRDMLQKLLKYKGKNEEADIWIEKLEANLYRGAKHPINRKMIRKLLENFV